MKNLIVIISIAAFILAGCSKKNEEPSKYSVEGSITNVSFGRVADAEVSLIKDGRQVHNIRSEITGKFSLSGVMPGVYKLKVSKPGYEPFEQDSFQVSAKSPKKVISLWGRATMAGRIIDSQTGRGIANAMLLFSLGDTVAVDSLAEVRIPTDGFGNFNMDSLPTGIFCNAIYAEGRFRRLRRNIEIVEGLNQQNEVTLVVKPNPGELRIVLTWGATPSDLDAHFSGPLEGSANRYHVYFANKTPFGANANLDIDDVSSYGPETTTLTGMRDGLYRYSVHNYSVSGSGGAASIRSSGATVEVYDDQGMLKSFTPPISDQTGNTWRVFEFNIAGGAITSVQQVGTYLQSSHSDGSNFRVAGKADLFKGSKAY